MAVTSPLPWVRGSPHARKRGEQGSGPGLLGAGLVLRAPGQCSLSRSVLPHRMLGGKCVCSPDLAKATPRPPPNRTAAMPSAQANGAGHTPCLIRWTGQPCSERTCGPYGHVDLSQEMGILGAGSSVDSLRSR